MPLSVPQSPAYYRHVPFGDCCRVCQPFSTRCAGRWRCALGGLPPTRATRKGFNMAGGDDDYGDAFKKAKLEHDQELEAPTEAKRLQAEADADIAVLSDVVLPQLQAAAQKLQPLGGIVEIRQYGRTGSTLRPASVAFRITDQQDQH